MRFHRVLAALAANVTMASLLVSVAQGGFNANGVESFEGTTLDASTWRIVSSSKSLLSQNSQLNLVTDGSNLGSVNYKAVTPPISVGGYAQVDLVIRSHDTAVSFLREAGLVLTSNISKPPSPSLPFYGYDTFHVDLLARFNEPYTEFIAGTGALGSSWGLRMTAVGSPNQVVVPSLETTYAMRIEWLNATTFRNSVYNSSGNLLCTADVTVANTSSQVFVCLEGKGVSASFDNVVVGGVPEPGSAAMLVLGGVGLLLRPCRSRGVKRKSSAEGQNPILGMPPAPGNRTLAHDPKMRPGRIH